MQRKIEKVKNETEKASLTINMERTNIMLRKAVLSEHVKVDVMVWKLWMKWNICATVTNSGDAMPEIVNVIRLGWTAFGRKYEQHSEE